MIAGRILALASKLATVRSWQSTLASELGVEDADEDELYSAMDWLLRAQPTNREGRPVAVDVFEGNRLHDGDGASRQAHHRLGISEVAMFGARGMLISARIEALKEIGRVAWISALRSLQIEGLYITRSGVGAYTIMPRSLATATVGRILYHAPLVPTEGAVQWLA